MVSDPAIWMNGLYPGPATAPGWNLASGNPSGPGTAMRVGLKSGAPAKLIGAGPKWFCYGVGLIRWTVCTHAGQEMPMLASLGAKFTPRSSRGARVGGVLQDVPDLLLMRGAGVGDPGVDRQPHVLLAEVDLDGAWQGQLVRGQDAAELPQPMAASAGTCAARADGAADAAVPVPAAMASDVLAATPAASTAISPRFLARTRLNIRRFTSGPLLSPLPAVSAAQEMNHRQSRANAHRQARHYPRPGRVKGPLNWLAEAREQAPRSVLRGSFPPERTVVSVTPPPSAIRAGRHPCAYLT